MDLVVLVVITFVAATVNGAIGPPSAMAADKAASTAKALFTQAQSKYNKGEFSDALKLYSDAYDLKQAPIPFFDSTTSPGLPPRSMTVLTRKMFK